MTDDELDLLASTYVDGEATPEEVALVERDPELQDRVAEFRALQVNGPVTPPPGLVDRQIAAAIAEFEAIRSAGEAPVAVGSESVDAEVVDFSQRRAGGGRGGGAQRSTGRSERPTRGMPSWLPAAAVFLLIGGGLIWVVGQSGGSDDSAETAGAELADQTDASDDVSEDDSADSDDDSDDGLAATEAESAPASDDDDAMGDESGNGTIEDSEEADISDEESAEEPESGPDGDASDEDGENRDLDREPKAFFTQIPAVEDIDFSPEDLLVIDESVCGLEVAAGELGQPLGFLPVEIAGQPAELLVFADADGAEVRVLVDDLCQPLEAGN